MDPIPYDCEGCGYTIWNFSGVPRHRLCAICLFVCEACFPENIMEMRRRCEPGGWESERERRAIR